MPVSARPGPPARRSGRWWAAMKRSSSRSRSADASPYSAARRVGSSERRRPRPDSSARNGWRAATNLETASVRLLPAAASRTAWSSTIARASSSSRSRVGASSASASRKSMSAAISRRPSWRYASRSRHRRAATTRRAGDRVGGVGRVVPPVDPVEALRRGAHAGQRPADAAPAVRGQPFEGAAVEASVAAGRRPRLDPALIGPATEGVGIDAEQAAGRAERQPATVSSGGSGDVGHEDLGAIEVAPTGGPAVGGDG